MQHCLAAVNTVSSFPPQQTIGLRVLPFQRVSCTSTQFPRLSCSWRLVSRDGFGPKKRNHRGRTAALPSWESARFCLSRLTSSGPRCWVVPQDRARVEMDTVAYVEHGGALAGGSMLVDGDLALRQTWPLSVYGGKRVRPDMSSLLLGFPSHASPRKTTVFFCKLLLWLGLRVCPITFRCFASTPHIPNATTELRMK